jgi:thiol-disulfide isomerase/thioredoxin
MKIASLLKPHTLFTKFKKKNTLIILLIVLVGFAAAFFSWKKYGLPKLNKLNGKVKHSPNKEIINSDKSATIYYFYTEWCPYCKKARPEWDKFKDIYSNESINGYTLEFIEVDCDKDEATAGKFKIEGYPTIKLIKDGKIIEYDAKPKFETLETFVKSSL